MAKRTVSKIKSSMPEGTTMDTVPNAGARPGEWRKSLVRATLPSGEVHKSTEVPPSVQEQMITEIANGIPAAEVERKYEVGRGYLYSLMVRRFGSIEAMKRQLTSMCYENAMVFMEFAQENVRLMTPAQAVLSAKLSVDAGISLEKSVSEKPATIDFAALQQIGLVLGRVEKIITGTDRTLGGPTEPLPS